MDEHHEYSGRIPAVGVGVMLLRDGKCMLGQRIGAHGASTYGWCGGGLEFGETLEECARREVLEEAGIEIGSLKLICVSNIRDYDKHYIDFEFLCEDFTGEPRVMQPESVKSWEWYDVKGELPQPLFHATALGISSYLSGNFYNA